MSCTFEPMIHSRDIGPEIYLFWQWIDHNIDVHYQVKCRFCMPWTPIYMELVLPGHNETPCPLSSQSEQVYYCSNVINDIVISHALSLVV